jgi:hypothetical protein
MWTYNSANGRLYHNQEFVDKGYSGHEEGKNNPNLEDHHQIGPIPRGTWKIGPISEAHPNLGPHVMALTPVGHDAHGRSAFFIHGDSVSHPGEASHGCIILQRETRMLIGGSRDNDLHVV